MLTFSLCVGDVLLFAKMLVQSGLLTEHKTPEALAALILIGRELGLSSIQSLRLLTIENGSLRVSIDTLLMLARKNTVCLYLRIAESSPTKVICETHRRGEAGPTKLVYTLKEANLTGDEENLEVLLRERCLVALVRQVYPELLVGLEVRFAEVKKKQTEALGFNEKTRRFILEDLDRKAEAVQNITGLRALVKVAKNSARARVITTEQLDDFLSRCKQKAQQLGASRVQEKLLELEAAQTREELDELRLWFDGVELTREEEAALSKAFQQTHGWVKRSSHQ